jgi:hypothetical protein
LTFLSAPSEKHASWRAQHLNNNDFPHTVGLVSSIQPQLSKGLKKRTILLSFLLGSFICLGSLGFVCVLNGGSVRVQFQDLIVIFSGQSKAKEVMGGNK